MKNINGVLLTVVFVMSTTLSYSQTSVKSSSELLYTDHILGGMTCVIVQHAVADFATWESAYQKDEKRRKKEGISEKLVLRGAGNPNDITVVFEVNNAERARGFFTDPITAELMGAAGVTSKPVLTYFKVNNSGLSEGQSFLVIRHTVSNYDSWKKAFDKHGIVRSEYGISLAALGSELDDPTNVVAIFNSEKPSDITSFLEKSDLKEAMKNAGITSEPIVDIGILCDK